MFNAKQKLSHLLCVSSINMYTCFHLRFGKEMTGWVYNTWLLYQLLKMKVFGYFSKFLLTCCLTTRHVCVGTIRVILNIIFIKGSIFSSYEQSAMIILPIFISETATFTQNYLTTIFLSLWNKKKLLLICKINFFFIKMFIKIFQDRKNTVFTSGTKFTFAMMVDVEILYHQTCVCTLKPCT